MEMRFVRMELLVELGWGLKERKGKERNFESNDKP